MKKCQCCKKQKTLKNWDICQSCAYAIQAVILDGLRPKGKIKKYLLSK